VAVEAAAVPPGGGCVVGDVGVFVLERLVGVDECGRFDVVA